MSKSNISVSTTELSRYDRGFFRSDQVVSYIGKGEIGGKASGLAFIQKRLDDYFSENRYPGTTISIPKMIVLTTGLFDEFIKRNRLSDLLDDPNNSDQQISFAFQQAEFPAEFIGDLRSVIIDCHTPLAIRSSSLLEDAMFEPFAGVYMTKMIPNNQPDPDLRFRKLVEAIKLVLASTYFKTARDYHRIVGKNTADEKMAVIIQQVVGEIHNRRYYPNISGVARSYNFYPTGKSKPEDGVIDLALGLGKTIVDGGLTWVISPARPFIAPPVGSASELLKKSQTTFWAVNLDKPSEYDPMKETEYMVQADLPAAEYDNTLRYIASTYRPADDQIVMGTGNPGPRLLNFAPFLKNDFLQPYKLIKILLEVCEKAIANEVEIEFAINIYDKGDRIEIGFLQVRPMVVSHEQVFINNSEMTCGNAIVASENVLGNGIIDNVKDIVYVDPDAFDAQNTQQIASEINAVNEKLVEEGRPYLLIGFGRWGSSDPWLGIPVEWSQISGARVIVEATLPNMNVELSQGSHFFHNISSFQIPYFLVNYNGNYNIDWDWLRQHKNIISSGFVKQIRFDQPIYIKVDGRCGKGVILQNE